MKRNIRHAYCLTIPDNILYIEKYNEASQPLISLQNLP